MQPLPLLTHRGVELDPTTPSIRELCVTPASRGPVKPANDACTTVPHFWWRIDKKGAVNDVRSPPTFSNNIQFRGSLRDDEQHAAAAAIVASLHDHGGGVAALPTGFGKTVLGLYAASHFKTRTLIIVHKAFLAQQWHERASQFVPSASLTTLGLGKQDVTGDIVVATIQTLLARPQALHPTPHAFGLVIVDECHRIAAPSFCQCMFKVGLCAKYVLGLSATPTRTDGLERVIHWLCGPLIEHRHLLPTTLTPTLPPTLPPTVAIVRPTFPVPRTIPLNRMGDVDHASLLSALADDHDRTAFIVDQICRCVPEPGKRDVLVLSHRRAHCHALADQLRTRGFDAQTYLGGDKTVPTTKVICSTYALVSEGFDQPRLTVLVLATPASHVVQAVGRILRSHHGPARLIIDILDSCSVCYAQAAKRKALYVSRGWMGKQRQQQYQFRDD